MPSYFEINVAKLVGQRWEHYFATAPRSFRDKETAYAALCDLRERFPSTEGFKITMTYWECIGRAC
jgi:hypothetical protein